MSAAYYPQVQKIYVAYYGRPADPAGLQYWAGQLAANGGNLTSIINAFGNSSESTALYAGASDSAKVTAIYQQLFNRAPDSAGLAFYTAELTAGRMTAASIALNVANGATGVDATYLANKVTVGTAFTDALTVDSAAAVAYTGTTAITAARSLITGVTTSAATTNVASTITSIKSGGGATAGQTFTLTTSATDEIQGGTGDDTVNGTTSTIAATDDIDGGAGNDTLNITASAALAAVTVDNVETVNVDVRFFDTTTALDFTNIEVDNVNISGSIAGFSNTVTVTAGGDNNYNFGSNITTATFTALERGTVKTGSLTTLNTTLADTEVNLTVQGTTVAFNGDAGITDMNVAFDGGGTLDIQSVEVLTGDLVITGTGTVRGAGTVFEGAEIQGADATLRIDAAATADMDLTDINVGTIRIDTATLGFTNAEGKTFDMRTASTFVADTSDDGGEFTLNVNVDNATSITTAAATNSAANAINHTGATVNFNATSTIDNVALVTVGGDTTLNVSGSAFTFTSIAEANTSAKATVTGNQTLTVTTSAVTDFDASAYTGAITFTNAHTGASSTKTGSAADTVNVDADTAQTYYLGAGNDTLNITPLTSGSVFVDLGDGNDTIDFNNATLGAASSIVIIGGAGTDTIDIDETANTNLGVGSLTISGVEIIDINAFTFTFDATTLSGQTGLAINGTAAAAEAVTIVTAATDTKLDLSGVTYTNVDTSTITLSTSDTTVAFTGTLTNMADTVAGLATTNGFTLDLGAGNDTITLALSAGTAGSGGTLKLGAGNDTVVMALDSTKVATGQLVKISDFSNSVDVLNVVSNAVGVDVLAGASIDVSAATTSTTDSFSAYVTSGKIILVGTDAANVDTLAEWVAVAGILAGAAPGAAAVGAYMFEFGGNTYVTDQDATGVEVATIELTGITGMSLGLGGGSSVITVS